MGMAISVRPTFGQWARYQVGGVLPASLRDWVREDVVGPGATARYVARFVIPPLPILALLFLVPGPWWLSLGMIVLLLVPLAYFCVSLSTVYRRHRLSVHGLDPELVDEQARRTEAAMREDYERRHRG